MQESDADIGCYPVKKHLSERECWSHTLTYTDTAHVCFAKGFPLLKH